MEAEGRRAYPQERSAEKVLERQQPNPAHADAGAGGHAAGGGAHLYQLLPPEIHQA